MKKIFFTLLFIFTLPLLGYCVDNDNDGMPDEWELAYGLDITRDDSLEDNDNDGLTNIFEYQIGTYPNNPDSDNDGLPDGKEIAQKRTINVNTTTFDMQHAPEVISLSDRYLICWTSKNTDGDKTGIYGQFIDRLGRKIGSEFKINTTITGDQYYPMMAKTDSSYLIAWAGQSQVIKPDGKYGQIMDINGTPIGSEFFIDSYIQYLSKPRIASNGTGLVVVGCTHNANDTWDKVFAQFFDNEGTPIAVSVQVNTDTTGNHWHPIVASNGSNYMVVWLNEGLNGDSDGIFGQLLDGAGTKIGTQIQINTYPTDSQSYPKIISNGSDYMVVWDNENQDGNRDVFGQIISPTGDKIGQEITITIEHDQYGPYITSNGSTYLVAWTSNMQDGNGSGVYGQYISNSGIKRGGEFLINTLTASNQEVYSVTTTDNYFFVLWDSRDATSNATKGLFGSFFNDCGIRIGKTFQVTSQMQPIADFLKKPVIASIGEELCIVYPYVNDNWDIGAMITSVDYGTDPMLPDTDGDGMNDGDEIKAGTLPDNPQSVFAITGIYTNSAGDITLQWSGSTNPCVPYKIRWLDSLDAQQGSIDLLHENVTQIDNMRTWTDEGDNDAIAPRNAPSSEPTSMRLYQIYIQ
ncbi:MAG: hypothetical protein RBU23_06520 [Candidatus Auribacterota bacterium]|jgi:hypothetical protein|nr:hypothetical protein [Candidatus Auribacterota bacterium]